MRRRETGAALIAVAVLAAVLLPAIGGRELPGRPQGIPLIAAPAVGDCLLTPIEPVRGDDGVLGGQVSDPAAFDRCAGRRWGEVTAVLDGAGGYTGGNSDGRYLSGTFAGAAYVCDYQTQDYQGVPAALRGGARYADIWTATPATPSVSVTTDEEQRAAGQTWTACVAVRAGQVEGQLTPYDGSVRDVHRTGVPPAGDGSCEDLADATVAQPVPCDEPHAVEVMGVSSVVLIEASTGRLVTDPLLSSCAELVELLTRSDLRADGDLTVRVDGDGDGGETAPQGSAPGPDAPAGVRCAVVAAPGRTLSGTLLGLGERPVPWS